MCFAEFIIPFNSIRYVISTFFNHDWICDKDELWQYFEIFNQFLIPITEHPSDCDIVARSKYRRSWNIALQYDCDRLWDFTWRYKLKLLLNSKLLIIYTNFVLFNGVKFCTSTFLKFQLWDLFLLLLSFSFIEIWIQLSHKTLIFLFFYHLRTGNWHLKSITVLESCSYSVLGSTLRTLKYFRFV